MSRYSIDTGEVVGIVVAVQEHADAFGDSIKVEGIQDDLEGVSNVPAPGVASALAGYVGSEVPNIEEIGNRITACLLGASQVVNSYGQASDEMLANIQSEAVAAAADGDFSYFEQ